jgi:hypothetical protein
MRLHTAAALLAVALSGCGNGSSSSPGKSAGAACSAGAECASGLVCFHGACAASYPAAASCAAAPGSPRFVAGAPVAAVEPAPGACVTDARATVPATTAAPVGQPIPSGAFVDLGEHGVGTTLTVDVPPGASSLTIVSQDVGSATVRDIVVQQNQQSFRLPNTVVPTNVRAPGSAPADPPFFSDTAALPTDAGGYDDVTNVLAYYAGFTAVAGAFSIPNTARSLDLVRSAGEVPPGTWSFTVNDWAQECAQDPRFGCAGSTSGVYRVAAYARPGPIASTGTLDLEVYLATDPNGPLPNADAVVANPATARFVSKLSEFFGHAGICLGTVTFRDIPDWARTRYAPAGQVDISGAGPGGTPSASQTPSGCDDLSQLFTVAVAPSRAVHLFLAEDLVDASSANGTLTVLGIDGSIPGPSGVPGTVNGGAILGTFGLFGAERRGASGACRQPSSAGFGCGTDVLAYVAAHEAGHWLGLYHTTEATGTNFDPLTDTGRCPCARCAPSGERASCAERGGGSSPTLVDASLCAGPSSPIAELAGRALPGAGCTGARNLMFWQFDPSVAEGQLSPQQGEIIRLNPAVR